MNKKGIIFSRWTAVIPAAVLSIAIPTYLMYLFLKSFDLTQTLGNYYDVSKYTWGAIGGVAGGYLFVDVGTRMAPGHKKQVAISLCVLVSTLIVSSVFKWVFIITNLVSLKGFDLTNVYFDSGIIFGAVLYFGGRSFKESNSLSAKSEGAKRWAKWLKG